MTARTGDSAVSPPSCVRGFFEPDSASRRAGVTSLQPRTGRDQPQRWGPCPGLAASHRCRRRRGCACASETTGPARRAALRSSGRSYKHGIRMLCAVAALCTRCDAEAGGVRAGREPGTQRWRAAGPRQSPRRHLPCCEVEQATACAMGRGACARRERSATAWAVCCAPASSDRDATRLAHTSLPAASPGGAPTQAGRRPPLRSAAAALHRDEATGVFCTRAELRASAHARARGSLGAGRRGAMQTPRVLPCEPGRGQVRNR